MAIPPRVSVLIGARALMSWNVSAGKPRQSQPEHKRSRKTQAGQTPKQRNKRTALRENVPQVHAFNLCGMQLLGVAGPTAARNRF